MNLTQLVGRHRQEQGDNATPAVQSDTVARARTAATISAELGAAKDAAIALAAKLIVAQTELSDARTRYDKDIQAYALDDMAGEPDRSALESAITRTEALRRVGQTQQRDIARLTGELSAAELAETVSTERELVPAAVAAATAALEAFERSATEAKNAEATLFKALFGRTGLKRDFTAPELNAGARAARFGLRDRAIAVAKALGYAINPDFSTDGNVNLASPQGQYELAVAAYERDTERRRECAGVPVERGELVPEDRAHFDPYGLLAINNKE